jgi:hypothetical protein
VCNSQCSIGDDYFGSANGYNDNYDNHYGDDNYDDWDYGSRGSRNNRGNRKDRNDRNRNNSDIGFYDNELSGKYHVREIDEYVTINRTRYGLKAKRGKDNWIEYTQNRNRKNEYVDQNGNKYLVKSDDALTWKNRKGTISLNLKK